MEALSAVRPPPAPAPAPAPVTATAYMYTPAQVIGHLLQVYFFLQTFSEVLGDETTLEGLSLRALDAALADGDHPIVHKVHVAVLSFLAKASLDGAAPPQSVRAKCLPCSCPRSRLRLCSDHGWYPCGAHRPHR